MGCGKKDNINSSTSTGCICQVVRTIKDIQDNAQDVCECPSNCFLEPLGALSPSRRRNERPDTRVFVLKDAKGSPFHAFFFNGREGGCVSIFFRVEEVFDNCCAVLRVLEPVKHAGKGGQEDQTVNLASDGGINLSTVCEVDFFRRTNDCITVDLNCFCAVQCIADVDLDVCED